MLICGHRIAYSNHNLVHVPLNPILTLNLTYRMSYISARLSYIGRHAVSFGADRELPTVPQPRYFSLGNDKAINFALNGETLSYLTLTIQQHDLSYLIL